MFSKFMMPHYLQEAFVVCIMHQIILPELAIWAMSVGPICYRHKVERRSYAGGSGRRQVGHSIFISIHLCKQPEWKK